MDASEGGGAMTCVDCEGAGCSGCANCGDGHDECCCNEHECVDCDRCLGTGEEPSDEDDTGDDLVTLDPEEDP